MIITLELLLMTPPFPILRGTLSPHYPGTGCGVVQKKSNSDDDYSYLSLRVE